MPTPLLKALLKEKRLPWRYKNLFYGSYYWFHENILIPSLIITAGKINKAKLKKDEKLNEVLKQKDDINVILVIKDRYERLANSLSCIRNQTYDQDLIKITLVDYDSDKKFIPKYKELCKKFNAEYLRVNNKPIWSLAHASNIAIKKTKEKYIQITGEDLLYDKDYIKNAINLLKNNPLQIISSKFYTSTEAKHNDFEKIKESIEKRRYKLTYGPGLNLGLTHFYKKIRGHDEYYKIWGKEDRDIMKRFRLLGLKIKMLKPSVIHLWHPPNENFEFKYYEKNLRHYLKTYSIIRNDDNWGEF